MSNFYSIITALAAKKSMQTPNSDNMTGNFARRLIGIENKRIEKTEIKTLFKVSGTDELQLDNEFGAKGRFDSAIIVKKDELKYIWDIRYINSFIKYGSQIDYFDERLTIEYFSCLAAYGYQLYARLISGILKSAKYGRNISKVIIYTYGSYKNPHNIDYLFVPMFGGTLVLESQVTFLKIMHDQNIKETSINNLLSTSKGIEIWKKCGVPLIYEFDTDFKSYNVQLFKKGLAMISKSHWF